MGDSQGKFVWYELVTSDVAAAEALHDFRRTAARIYVRTGTPEGVAMEILGHKTRSSFDRYNVTSEDERRQAAVRAGTVPVGEALGKNGEKSGGDAG